MDTSQGCNMRKKKRSYNLKLHDSLRITALSLTNSSKCSWSITSVATVLSEIFVWYSFQNNSNRKGNGLRRKEFVCADTNYQKHSGLNIQIELNLNIICICTGLAK